MYKKNDLLKPINNSMDNIVKAIIKIDNKNNRVLPSALTDGIESPIFRAKAYILDDGNYIIQGRGLIRALRGTKDDGHLSGQRMHRLFTTKIHRDILSEEVRGYLDNPIEFYTKNKKIEWGYNAKVLPKVARDLLLALTSKKITESHAYYQEALNSRRYVDAFLDLSITSHIQQITDFNPYVYELTENFFKSEFVSVFPSKHRRKFEELGFFDSLYRLYNLEKNKKHPWKNPQFFGKFINQYIYEPLDVVFTDGKAHSNGIIKKLLKDKKADSDNTLYSFIQEVGEAKFFGHLGTITTFMKLSQGSPVMFKDLFKQAFSDLYQKNLFDNNISLERLKQNQEISV